MHAFMHARTRTHGEEWGGDFSNGPLIYFCEKKYRSTFANACLSIYFCEGLFIVIDTKLVDSL
jgi:hypothetical protein